MSRRRAKGRPVNGVLLLDKPLGISSNRALQIVKRLFNANKAGHTGSLDPLASGVLPICLGEATKFSSWLLDADKRYQTVCKLGELTTTGDAEGEVIETLDVPDLDQDAILATLGRFKGEIKQVPPMYSALKHNGQPLYKLARQGLEIERKSRQVTIYDIDLLARSDNTLTLDVRCSKGTYIRTLAEDIGKSLGCGAHITMLRRTEAARFGIDQCYTLEALEACLEQSGTGALDDLLLPTDCMLSDWPLVTLEDQATKYVLQGRTIKHIPVEDTGWVRIRGSSGQFIGIGELNPTGELVPRRLISEN